MRRLRFRDVLPKELGGTSGRRRSLQKYGLPWPGRARRGMVWHGSAWQSMAWSLRRLCAARRSSERKQPAP